MTSTNSPVTSFPQGIKQSDSKLSYELDWGFIQQMAERMQINKHKYPPYNWQKPIDKQSLKEALTRHFIAFMQGELTDDGREFGHLEALACNAMILNYQYKYFQEVIISPQPIGTNADK